jgi:hypothetical protein
MATMMIPKMAQRGRRNIFNRVRQVAWPQAKFDYEVLAGGGGGGGGAGGPNRQGSVAQSPPHT